MTDEQMKERLESAEKILREAISNEEWEAQDAVDHFAKYTTSQDKLKNYFEKWWFKKFKGSEVLDWNDVYTIFKSHFSDFLLTPEKEAQLTQAQTRIKELKRGNSERQLKIEQLQDLLKNRGK